MSALFLILIAVVVFGVFGFKLATAIPKGYLMNQLKELVRENKVVVVDVYGQNCPDCVKFAPVLDQVAAEHKGIKFVKIEAPKGSQTRKELNDFLDPSEPSILRIPAVILFRDGKPSKLHFGPMSAPELHAFIA